MSLSYRTILIDPPWMERGGGKIKRGADRHYPLLKPPEILAVILQSGVWTPAAGCHLYCWVTNNFVPTGIWLVEALGFRYITLLTWVKDRFGLGQYFRGQTEQLIFGVRGSQAAQTKNETTLIDARRGRHSAKPEEAYAKIERVSPGPRLEMFARTPRPGWICWGNEAGGLWAQ